MHRFFIRPESLGYQAETYNRWDDPKWCALVGEFRWSIRLREWKVIDNHFRLMVKVEEWDGQDVLLIANPMRDSSLADAYIKAAFLEDQAIIVFAQDNIPWARLKPFRASLGGRTHRDSGATAKGEPGEGHPRPIGLPRSGTQSLVSSRPNKRTGKPDILAGGRHLRPKQKVAVLSVKGQPNSQSPMLAERPSPLTGEGVIGA